jgi:hypothetical protein
LKAGTCIAGNVVVARRDVRIQANVKAIVAHIDASVGVLNCIALNGYSIVTIKETHRIIRLVLEGVALDRRRIGVVEVQAARGG